MNILLKSLTLTNFKGIRSRTIEFGPCTYLFGRNGVGKTSFMDAYTWLLFGKDSSDRKDFEIKTLDENNQPYHNLDHEVQAVIEVDGKTITLRRSLREKWVTKRGSKEPVFSGHETSFFWNDVPLKESEYTAKVAQLIDEQLFKLLSSTSYFNSLKWQERRQVLMHIAGDISNEQILERIANLSNKEQIAQITAALSQGKSIEEFKKELSAKRKKLKDELQLIPSRIDEASRALPEEKDYNHIATQINQIDSEYAVRIAAAKKELEGIEAQLLDISKAEEAVQKERLAKVQEVGDLKQQVLKIELRIKEEIAASKRQRESAIQEKRRELRNLQDGKSRKLQDYQTAQKNKETFEITASNLRRQWTELDQQQLVFDENEFSCPACKRAYETSDIEAKKSELTRNFNEDKSRRLSDLAARGTEAADKVKVLTAEMGNIKAEGEALNARIESVSKDIETLEQEDQRLTALEAEQTARLLQEDTEAAGIREMIRLREEQIAAPSSKTSADELQDRKRAIELSIDTLRNEQTMKIRPLSAELSTKDLRLRGVARIKELKYQESSMAQELARIEGVEFAIEEFDKAHMDELVERINSRFRIAKFKMFNQQINGGLEPTCETLIDGVPYSDANTASKVQAGLDIINTLSDHYGIKAPVWIDNRESVITLPETSCQLINLVASRAHKELTVEAGQEEAVA